MTSRHPLPAAGSTPAAGVTAHPGLVDHGPTEIRAHRRMIDAHPWITDVTVTVLLGVLTALPLHRAGVTSPGVWLLDLALVGPLVLRRRHPLVVFYVIAAVACAQWLTGERLAADAALLLALYTVATRESRRRAAVAAGVLELGVVLASVRFAPVEPGVVGSLVFLSGLVAAAFFLGTSVRTRREYLASVEDRAVRLEHEREQQGRLVATAERTRIAREMHDIVAHSLSIMITLADGAALANRTGPPAATDAMTQVSSTGRQALSEMRGLLGVLREEADQDEPADLAPQPGLDQIEPLLGQVRNTGLAVRMSVRGQPRTVPLTGQLTIYRVIQEALTNILKHGREVTAVHVVLDWGTTGLDVGIRDDGAPVRTVGHSPGMGLRGMRERLAVHGGVLTAGPATGRGWAVSARLPLGAEQA
jgi:signal transduction histidine kinase